MSIPRINLGIPNAHIYTDLLASAYSTYYRLYNPSYALSKDPDVYEVVMRDPTVKQAMKDALQNIAGAHWRMKPASSGDQDKLAAGIIEKIVGSMPGLLQAQYELAMSRIRGRSFQRIYGKRIFKSFGIGAAGSRLPPQNWWVPTKLKDVDERRFEYRPVRIKDEITGREKITTELWIREIANQSGTPDIYNEIGWIKVPYPEWFVKYTYGDIESHLGYGTPELDALYFWVYSKGILWQQGLRGAERFAEGLIEISMDEDAPASTTKDNDTIREEYISVAEKMRARNVFVHSKKDEFKIHEPTGTAHQIILNLVNYCDEKITRLITGSLLPSGGGGETGSLARAEVEQTTTDSGYEFDRRQQDEVLTHDFVKLVWSLNRGPLVALGLGDAQMPGFSSTRDVNLSPKEAIEIQASALAAGAPIREDEFYANIKLTPPKDGDRVIQPRQLQPAIPQFPALPEE